MSPAFAFLPAGGIEVVVLIVIFVLLFWGPKKLPQLARAMGQSTNEFKKGREELEEELQEQKQDQDGEAETNEEPEQTQ